MARTATGRALRVQGFREAMSSPALKALTTARGTGALQISVQVLPDSTQRALRRLAEIAPQVEGEMDTIIGQEAQVTVQRIKEQWPVDTGFSKAMWNTVRLGSLNWLIQNLAVYSGYVHRKGERTPLSETLVPLEVSGAQERIARRLVAVLQRIRQSGAGGASAPAATPTTPSGLGGAARSLARRFISFFGF